MSRSRGPTPRLNDIEGVRIVGAKALVQFTSSVGPVAKRQVLRMLLIDGAWRVDSDGAEEL